MCAYSNVNSIPSCQNPEILNDALYQQAGFTGFVTSDWVPSTPPSSRRTRA
jgi:beta-glucosidase